MWAWRSFLSGANPLHSRAWPVRRHRSKNLIGPRAYVSGSNAGWNAEGKKQDPKAATKRHLYVVVDDHKDSYGIHKLDMDDDKDGDLEDGGHASSPRRLPVLPACSVALSTLGERAQFAALGSRIVAIGRKQGYSPYDSRVLMYDTKTAEMVVSPKLPDGLCWHGYVAAMAVGQRMYFLESVSEMYCLLNMVYPTGEDAYMGGLHCLAADSDSDIAGGDELWKWRPLYPSSRWSWSNNAHLLVLPFQPEDIVAHALHAPPGAAPHHDIYVSAQLMDETPVTFSFSTASGEWTLRGNWHLPFVGHAHYDCELEGWLGLHAANEGTGNSWYCPSLTDGHLCAGNIASAPSEWKVSREKVFHLDEDAAAGWRHYDAKLVPMAPSQGRNEYCLMERLQPEGDKEYCLGDGEKWLLRLTVFRVERGQDGGPMVTACRQARSYIVPRYNKYFDAQAFSM